jgi:hypothetical protein
MCRTKDGPAVNFASHPRRRHRCPHLRMDGIADAALLARRVAPAGSLPAYLRLTLT